MNNKIVIKNINEMNKKYKNDYEGYEYNKYEVTERKDFSQIYVSFYEIMPGKAAFPKHYHSYNTECFYIIDGEGKIIGKNQEYLVKKGDTIVFPCGDEGTHKLVNTSNEKKLIYLDVDTTNSPDIIHYTDSNKIGIIEHNLSSTFYREKDNVDYYDGEL